MVELTTAHWVYAFFVVLFLVTMTFRKDTPLVCIVASFVLGWVVTGSFVKGVQGVFNSVTVAFTELLGIIAIISLIVAMAKMLEETGLADMMFQPVQKMLVSPEVAFWVMGVVIMLVAWVIWPSPAIALVGALLLPAAIKAGLSPINAAMAISMFGRASLLFVDSVDIFSPALFTNLQIFRIHAVLFCKSHGGGQGDAVLVERLVRRWTLDQVFAVRLIRGKIVDRNHDPPRRRKDTDHAVFQAKLIQPGRDTRDKLIAGHGFAFEHNEPRQHAFMLIDHFIVDRAYGARFQLKDWTYVSDVDAALRDPWSILTDAESGTDDQKKFQVEFRDHAGNDSVACTGRITLDQTAPTPDAFWINRNRPYVLPLRAGEFTVFTHDGDGGSGVDAFKYTTDGGTSYSEWMSLRLTNRVVGERPAESGRLSVQVVVRDRVGNESDPSAPAETHFVDAEPPWLGCSGAFRGALSDRKDIDAVEIGLVRGDLLSIKVKATATPDTKAFFPFTDGWC